MSSKLTQGNSIDILKEDPDNFYDAVVTDFPYGYKFMGKSWDIDVPSVEVLKEILRVLKPGHFLLTTMAPRQDVSAKCIMNLATAGFEINFSPIYWTYASGFPKAMNISRKIDESYFTEWLKKEDLYDDLMKLDKMERIRQKQELKKKWITSLGLEYEEVDSVEQGAGCYQRGLLAQQNQKENYNPPKIYITPVKDGEYAHSHGVFGEKGGFTQDKIRIQENPNFRPNSQPNYSLDGESENFTINSPYKISAVTEEARRVDGMYGGFQPKPAVELILVAMKPMTESNMIEQAKSNYGGGTWLDNARIPVLEDEAEDPKDILNRKGGFSPSGTGVYNINQEKGSKNFPDLDFGSGEKGRFPANLLISDDILNDGTVYHGGGDKNRNNEKVFDAVFLNMDRLGISKYPKDCGSFSRYFSLDNWFDEKVKKVFPFFICPKPDPMEKNLGCNTFISQKTRDGRRANVDVPFQRGETLRKNTHPTVKPVQLMSYMLHLVTKPGDLILDPFMGSGTTGIAALISDRNFRGIDMDKKAVDIALARINYWTEIKKKYIRERDPEWNKVLQKGKDFDKIKQDAKKHQSLDSFF